MGVQILDCTLRDGGYVNNWEFGRHAIASILDKLEAGGVEIVECGFLTSRPRDEDCSLYGGPEAILPLLPQREPRAMFVAMIAMGEKELSPQQLPPCRPGGISGVRLTFRREDAERAFCWAAAILDKGYQVFFQPVGTAFYSDMELLRLVERVNRLRPFAFYMVDTLGSMYPGQVTRQFHLIHENMDPAIRLGFHGHNNLQLAFSNAQVLLGIQAKRQLILDSSVYGMGRGAGNLPTELITRYINQNIQSRYNVGMVMDIYDEYIAPLRREYQWGYSMAYHLAASHACHPNYAAYLINKQTLTMQDMESILRAIPQGQRVEFDKALVRRLYARHQSRQIDDTRAVIPNGKYISSPVTIRLNSTAFDGVGTFLLPITIERVTPDLPVSPTLGTAYLRINGTYTTNPFRPIDRSGWSVEAFSTEEPEAQTGYDDNGKAFSAIDDAPCTYWGTQWRNAKPGPPHWITIDMGKSEELHGFTIRGRADPFTSDTPKASGNPRIFNVDVSDDNASWTRVGTFTVENRIENEVYLDHKATARYFRITVTATQADMYQTCIADIKAF